LFPYDSNMLTARPRERVPSATAIGIGQLVGHALRDRVVELRVRIASVFCLPQGIVPRQTSDTLSAVPGSVR
jgi:hypothetical protein